jgi:hypothetical protein
LQRRKQRAGIQGRDAGQGVQRTAEEHAAASDALRREITRVATSRRVAEVGAKGEVTFRDDPARERRLAELQEEMRQCR